MLSIKFIIACFLSKLKFKDKFIFVEMFSHKVGISAILKNFKKLSWLILSSSEIFILTSFKIEPFLIGSLSFWLGNFLSGMLSFYYIKKLINVNFLNLKSIYQLVFILVFLFFLIELIKFYLDDILTIIVSILSLSIVLIFHFLYSKLNWISLARALILKK